ncbi:KTI12 family protein [Candidatus Saccharibacteria bacterium]|nr:KTI12 family protein [Candidatus Saccharibacteria bacterium]
MNHEEVLEEIFKEQKELYSELTELNDRFVNLDVSDRTPILIEFLGSARSGKTTAIGNISELFRKSGKTVQVIGEESVDITEDVNKDPKMKQEINSADYIKRVSDEVINIYNSAKNSEADVVIFDRSINDRFNWFTIFSECENEPYTKRLGDQKVDLLVVQTCDVAKSLERKFKNSLSLFPTKWTNYQICTEYLEAISKNEANFQNHANATIKLDTSDMDAMRASLTIAKEILDLL